MPAQKADKPWTLSLDGRYRLSGKGADAARDITIPAHVPGQVHLDLQREGIIPDPFWRDQADDCQWVEHREWTYERAFELADDLSTDWVELEFAGLDTFATIFLNDAEVGRTRNMFIPHRFEAGPLLRPGTNRLRVRFDSIWKHVEGKSFDAECAFDNHERLYVRRMQCTFRWDWVHRFVTAGIWQPVTLRGFSGARVHDIFVHTTGLSGAVAGRPTAQHAALGVDIETELRAAGPVDAAVSILDSGGTCVWQGVRALSEGTAGTTGVTRLQVELDCPRPWWPAGFGEQPLYQCRVELSAADGSVLHSKAVTFGIRTVEVRQLDDAPGSREEAQTRKLRRLYTTLEKNGNRPGRSFKLFVNDVEVFCKGGNWVPPDPFPARVTAQRYDHLVRMLRDGNQNMLRCWGGGIYEMPAFWDACNRYGILVCQDFMMACGQYPEGDPEFLDNLRQEVPAAVRMLRNHPSLAWWYGDNENRMGFADDDPAQRGEIVNNEVTLPALEKLDPSRPFFPSSPFGGNLNNSATLGDCHVSYNPGGDCHLVAAQGCEEALADGLAAYRQGIAETTGRFVSEIQSCGAPAIATLRRFMTDDDIADPQTRMWDYHTKCNPYHEMTLVASQFRKAELLFGKPRDLQQKVAFLEYLHYEWVRLTVESQRRQRYYCGGVLFWMYNDCWPANGWSLVDYYGTPKAGWYAFKRAARPVIASLHDAGETFEVWVCNDAAAPAAGTATLAVQPWQGAPTWQREFSVCAITNASERIAAVPKPEIRGLGRDAVLVCELSTNLGDDRAWHYSAMPREMAPPPAAARVTRRIDANGEGEIEIATDNYARIVTLAGENLVFTDNYFEMLPGDNRVIRSTRTSGSPAGDVTTSCWNPE